MKKWIFLLLMGAGGFVAYQHGYLAPLLSAEKSTTTRLFVGPQCGQPCDNVESVLIARKVPFDRIDVSTPEGMRYGVQRYPVTVVGEQTVIGDAGAKVVSALAENFGDAVLSPMERSVMQGHFDPSGKPEVVVYGTSWCTFCATERAYLAARGIVFVDVDVEASPAGRTAYDILRGDGYPLTYIGYRRIEGYNEPELTQAIGELL